MSHESALQPFSINFLSKRPKIGGDERVAVCLDVIAVLHLSALCLTGSRGEVLKGWGALLLPDQRSHGALISALMRPYNVLSLNFIAVGGRDCCMTDELEHHSCLPQRLKHSKSAKVVRPQQNTQTHHNLKRGNPPLDFALDLPFRTILRLEMCV